MTLKIVHFLALVLTALALAAPLAHLFSYLNKINVAVGPYFQMQRAYDNWWVVGMTMPLALIANLAAIWFSRGGSPAFSIAAAALIGLFFVIFLTWTHPANEATRNWTVIPQNWQGLRAQWENSHAVNAFVMLAAFCCAAISALRN